jgi:indolepyruvate ferredoxin oxidoreductase alpha subunit
MKIYSGNEAIARGAYEAAVGVVSSYPGTPSTEITENIAKYEGIYCEWATNEKVALEVALGAAFAGRRALTAMKHVGLNVAADPMMTASYTGVNAGLVIVVADDPNMHSSQNEQDSRNYARMAKLPMLEPADSAEALNYTKLAFELSEKHQCPVFLRSSTRISHSMSVVTESEPIIIDNKPYIKDANRWVMTPVNARVRRQLIEARLVAQLEDSEALATEHLSADKTIGIITSGVSYQYVREAMPEASVLKLGMVYPLPLAKIKAFASKVSKLYVVEELDRFIENELLAAGLEISPLERPACGELSVDTVRTLFGKPMAEKVQATSDVPVRLPNMCAGCSHRGIFYAISRLKLAVLGDIGCYTLGYMPPLAAMDSCVCMGASVSMAHGFDVGSINVGDLARKSVGVIGDSTFMHTGINGLLNTVYNGGTSTIVILDNSITGMTGHQPNPGSGRTIKGNTAPQIDMEKLCRALGVEHVHTVDPFDLERCTELLRQETAREAVSVIIAKRPCVFVDKSAQQAPYVITDACSGCKMCLKLGCPAISWDVAKAQAVIDQAMCNGCGLCPKVCRFGAIKAK